jgi:hypothetical protein
MRIASPHRYPARHAILGVLCRTPSTNIPPFHDSPKQNRIGRAAILSSIDGILEHDRTGWYNSDAAALNNFSRSLVVRIWWGYTQYISGHFLRTK